MASGSLPAKHIAVTFDDGWKSQLQAAEVLRSMKYTATFFIITGTFETPRYMSASDVKFLSKTFEIGAHSETHFMEWANDLSKLDVRVMHGEIAGSKFTLENLTGKWITSVSWPFGFTKPGNVEFAKHLGFITQAMVYTHKRNEAGSDPHQLSRLNIDGRCSIDIFLQMVQSGVEQHCK
jgi:peptidoglycan/xylan/chitin deacetylase (PgdA/CDA1 family)